MKRIIITIILIVAFAGIAHAGVWDKFVDVSINKIAGGAMAGIFFVLSALFGLKVKKWRKVATEGTEFAVWAYQATRPDSPGGASITGDELDDGMKNLGELGIAVAVAVTKIT
ncbi:MAG TPA: hypothetical protein ENH82_19410 [bacterium]|nr:hypothetical protein [bacterium]